MWSAIIGAVMGLAQMGYGAYQKNKSNKLAAANKFTDYSISDQYYNNLGLAESELANGGLSPESVNRLTQTNQQNLSASTNAILQAGGSVNDISKLYGVAANQNAVLAQLNDKLRMPKVAQLIEQRKELAGQEMYKWKINQFDRWRDKAAAAAMLGAQGNQAINGGLNTFAQGVGSAVSSKSSNGINDELAKMNKDAMGGEPNYTSNIMSMEQVMPDRYKLNPNPVSPDLPTLEQTQNQIQIEQGNPYAYNSATNFNPLFQ